MIIDPSPSPVAFTKSSKDLANRISLVLDNIILENQSAFVGERMILDSIVVLNEAIDEAKKKKIERMFFKIDSAKAYISVDWNSDSLI